MATPGTRRLARPRWSVGWRLGALVVGGGALLLLPTLLGSSYHLFIATWILYYALLATAWNILGGYAGQFSFGHTVYFATGAYTSTLSLLHFGLTPWLGMLVGGLLAAVIACAVGWPTFRLRGHYYAIATICLAEIAAAIVVNWDLVNRAVGLYLPILPEGLLTWQYHQNRVWYYYIALALLALALAVVWWIERSRLGYYLRAIREDEEAARALGIDTRRYKLIAAAISACLTAMAGTFYAQYQLTINPEATLTLALSVLICLMAVLGGTATIAGPVLGAVVLFFLSEWTRATWGGAGRGIDLMVYGGLIMLVAAVEPRGLVGLIGRARHRRAALPPFGLLAEDPRVEPARADGSRGD